MHIFFKRNFPNGNAEKKEDRRSAEEFPKVLYMHS
jgi:hypothetical protein